MNTRILTAFVAMACLVGTTAVRAQSEPTGDPYKKITAWQVGKDREVPATIQAEIRSANAAQHKAIEAKLIAALKAADATVDGKNFLCRMLSVVGSGECVPTVAPLIADEKTSHMARFALEAIQDPAAGAALRQALSQVNGKLLVGVISSVGARQDAQAVEALASLATKDGQEAEVAVAAILALGTIGTSEAAKALDAAKSKVGDGLHGAVVTAQIDAANKLAAAGKKAEAVAIFNSLTNDSVKAFRIAATRGLLGTLEKDEAVKLALSTLQSDDAGLRQAALAAIQTPSEKVLRDALAAAMPSFKPEAQMAVLGVLADQGDVNLRPALLKVLAESKDAQVRAAAIEGMVMYGEAADVAMLVKLAAQKGSADASAARKALERMGHSGVDEALIQSLNSADASSRSTVVSVLASRRTQAAVDALMKLMGSSDTAAAIDAVKGLEVLGTPAQLSKLASMLATTNDAGLRKATENAAAAICTRASDKGACSQAVLPALSEAKTAAGRSALLRVLPRIRDEKSLMAVRQATSDTDTEVREVAIRTLVDWPEFAAAPYVLELAKKTDNQTHAILALRGCIRLAGSAKDVPSAQRLEVYRSVLEIAKRDDEKKQALAGLGELPALGSLQLVQTYLKHPTLATDAVTAGIRLSRQLAMSYNAEAKAALKAIQAAASSDELRKQAEEAMKVVEAGGINDGYIVAWTLAGPYMQEGKDGSELFNVVFPPERGNGIVDWKPLAAGNAENPGFVELNRILGGDNRVAYLRTQITSAKEQEATLEMGSDDGLKVWLNNRLIHAKNVVRPFGRGDDKVKIKLNKGVNTLLVKVTQGSGEWSTGVRLRSATSGNLDDISVSAPTEK
ncbi:MAG: HEAT repeat domain-containing protein [Bacillota bacterium]